MQRWSFSFSRELPGRSLIEASYAGNRGTRLPTSRQIDDQAVIDSLSAARESVWPVMPPPANAGTNIGFSWYHSLQARVEKRFSHGISFNIDAGFERSNAKQLASNIRACRCASPGSAATARITGTPRYARSSPCARG